MRRTDRIITQDEGPQPLGFGLMSGQVVPRFVGVLRVIDQVIGRKFHASVSVLQDQLAVIAYGRTASQIQIAGKRRRFTGQYRQQVDPVIRSGRLPGTDQGGNRRNQIHERRKLIQTHPLQEMPLPIQNGRDTDSAIPLLSLVPAQRSRA